MTAHRAGLETEYYRFICRPDCSELIFKLARRNFSADDVRMFTDEKSQITFTIYHARARIDDATSCALYDNLMLPFLGSDLA